MGSAPIPVRLALKAGRCLPWLPCRGCPPSSRALATLPTKGPTTQLLRPPPEACLAPCWTARKPRGQEGSSQGAAPAPYCPSQRGAACPRPLPPPQACCPGWKLEGPGPIKHRAGPACVCVVPGSHGWAWQGVTARDGCGAVGGMGGRVDRWMEGRRDGEWMAGLSGRWMGGRRCRRGGGLPAHTAPGVEAEQLADTPPLGRQDSSGARPTAVGSPAGRAQRLLPSTPPRLCDPNRGPVSGWFIVPQKFPHTR